MRAIVLLFVVLGSCGRGSVEGQPAPMEAPRDPVDALSVLGRALTCGRAAACGESALSPSCPEIEPHWGGSDARLLLAIDAGVVQFSTRAVAECVKALETQCGAPLSCPAAFVGSLPRGAPCSISTECEPGLTCELDACLGTCQPKPLDGQPSRAPGDCAGGSAAKQADGGWLCAPPVPLGGSCTIGGVPQPCVEGAFCRLGTCVPPLANQAPCSSDDRCGQGLFCNGVRCVPLGKEGESCGVCLFGLECVEGRCRALASTAGESCRFECRAPAICWGGSCLIRQSAGGPCSNDTACRQPLRCLSSGTCGTAGFVGAPCADVSGSGRFDCEHGLECRAGRCAVLCR